MGLLDNQQEWNYYAQTSSMFAPQGTYEGGSLGWYQFVTLDSIISAFMVAYVGEDKIINKVSRTDVQFHAMRAIQELSYDVFRSCKSQEIEVPNTLKMILPQDYVNYVKLARVGEDGIQRPLYPTGKTSNPFAVMQNFGPMTWGVEDANYGPGGYPPEGSPPGHLGNQTNSEGFNESNSWQNYSSQTSGTDTNVNNNTEVEIDNYGRRYGLDPQHAQSNGTFFIDTKAGFIHFSSGLAGQTIVLNYVSDGLGTDDEMVVHKFCEEAVYKWISYGVLSTKSNIPEYIVQRYKKEKFAETRKAKIRLSNIKIEEFTQVIKGLSKPIK